MSKELEALEVLYDNAKLNIDRIEQGGIVTYAEEHKHNDRIKPYYDTIKQALLKLDFLEDAMDLPTNCFSTIKNRNDDEVTIMRRERYEEYQEQEKEIKRTLERWLELLETDGIDSKNMVATDIQRLLEEIGKC